MAKNIKKRHYFTTQDVQEAKKAYEGGMSICEIAKVMDTLPSNISRWKAQGWPALMSRVEAARKGQQIMKAKLANRLNSTKPAMGNPVEALYQFTGSQILDAIITVIKEYDKYKGQSVLYYGEVQRLGAENIQLRREIINIKEANRRLNDRLTAPLVNRIREEQTRLSMEARE